MCKTVKPAVTTCDCMLGEGLSVLQASCPVVVSDVGDASLICMGKMGFRRLNY